jgi:dihydropteroate synthase
MTASNAQKGEGFYPIRGLEVAPKRAPLTPSPMSWRSPHGTPLPSWRERTLVMGILNLTPDSFSDGGSLATPEDALRQAEALLAAGADVLDLGAESTRPGSQPLDARSELTRLLPTLRLLRQRLPHTPLSIDTYKAEVAAAALAEGADLINDVEGGRHHLQGEVSPMAQVCARADCPLILMHRRKEPNYKEFWPDFLRDLQDSLHLARLAGLRPEQLWTDPGFGFGKTPAQNLMLVRNLSQLVALGYPVLLGTSRKSTLGLVLDEPDPRRREAAHHATVTWGIAQGCAMIRAHDVAALRGVVRTADALRRSPNGGPG